MSSTYQNNYNSNYPQGKKILNSKQINSTYQLPQQQIYKNEYNNRVDN